MWVPPQADDGRIALAAAIDFVLAPVVGILAVWGLFFYSGQGSTDPVTLPLVGACTLAFSFINHVLGSLLFRASVGKLLLGLRVVQVDDGSRPGLARSSGRWLVGLTMHAVKLATGHHRVTAGEAVGVRVIHRRDERRSIS